VKRWQKLQAQLIMNSGSDFTAYLIDPQRQPPSAKNSMNCSYCHLRMLKEHIISERVFYRNFTWLML